MFLLAKERQAEDSHLVVHLTELNTILTGRNGILKPRGGGNFFKSSGSEAGALGRHLNTEDEQSLNGHFTPGLPLE